METSIRLLKLKGDSVLCLGPSGLPVRQDLFFFPLEELHVSFEVWVGFLSVKKRTQTHKQLQGRHAKERQTRDDRAR